MSDISIAPEAITEEEFHEWLRLVDQLAPLKEKEMALRKKIAGFYFQQYNEGTESVKLADGSVIKGKYSYSRDVDTAILGTLREPLAEMGIAVDAMVKWKPSLDTKAYKALTEEARVVFDQAVTLKIGSPSLEFIPKKEG